MNPRVGAGVRCGLLTGSCLLGVGLIRADGRPAPAGSALSRRIASVLPAPAERRWLQVPWQTDLTGARLQSRRAGKPLFLWVMEGHPLGCT